MSAKRCGSHRLAAPPKSCRGTKVSSIIWRRAAAAGGSGTGCRVAAAAAAAVRRGVTGGRRALLNETTQLFLCSLGQQKRGKKA